MIKNFCDICLNEIRQGELFAEFASLENNLTGKKNSPPIITSKYLACPSCSKEIKIKIIEMLKSKKS